MQGETSRAKILIVDDNEANRVLAESTLEDEGYRTVLASNGIDAIAAFEREHPDCVLLDVRMPDLDGFAVCERIRALPRGPEVPVLFLTALRDVDTFDRALRAGGDDFLTKPVRPTELIVRVQTALKLRRMSVELREHYDLLKRQRDDLMRVQLQKERLMAFVVHDLKNPVNSMDLHAQLMLRSPDLPESLREAAGQIRTEARHLTRMILNLLDISRGEEGQLNPKKVEIEVAPLITSIFSELGVNAAARGVKLDSAVRTPTLRGDEDLVRRTLTNLVENAIRFAPTQTSVTLAVDRYAGGVEVTVADEGPGIPAELRERVFDPFVQADTHQRPERTSRGLGLAFCKIAVQAHGGTVGIRDNANTGTIFVVRLPDER